MQEVLAEAVLGAQAAALKERSDGGDVLHVLA
jgi:hypothetical protein